MGDIAGTLEVVADPERLAIRAADIIADLSGKPRPPGRYRNTCWSMVAPDNSAKIGGDYFPGEKNGKPFLHGKDEFISKPDDSPAVRQATNQESRDWYPTVIADLFGEEPQMAGP